MSSADRDKTVVIVWYESLAPFTEPLMPHDLLTRRAAVAGLTAAPFAARAAGSGARFLVVGDWGRDGASHQREVAAAMGRAAQQSGARFIVSVGDNFYENGVRSARDRQWKTSFEDVYTAASLQVPWYVALGNHDYRGNPQAQVDYAKTSPRWRMHSRYFKVSGEEAGAPGVDLFFIDSSPLVHKYRDKVEGAIASNVAAEDVAAQLAWLDTGLGRSTAAWKLVVGHHTIYSGGSAHGNTPELLARIKPLLEKHGVQAYFNGHEHDMQHIRVGAVDYICSGAGSEVRPTGRIAGTKFCLSRSGFALIDVSVETLGLEFRDFTGARVYHADIARSRA